MKQSFAAAVILITAGIVLAACSSEEGFTSPPPQETIATTPSAEPTVNPFLAPDETEAADDGVDAAAKPKPATTEKTKPAEAPEVRLNGKASKKLANLVVAEGQEMKKAYALTASGAPSKAYAWGAEGLPEGLEFKPLPKRNGDGAEDGPKYVIAGNTSAVGEFTATITVCDAEDDTLCAEKELKGVVTDTIELTVKQLTNGVWTDAGSPVSIELASKTDLIKIVATAADPTKITWTIGGAECKADTAPDHINRSLDQAGKRVSCVARKDNAILVVAHDAPAETYLGLADVSSAGDVRISITVAVKTATPGALLKTKASIGVKAAFKADPCTSDLAVASKSISKEPFSSFQQTLKVSGGKGPYTWSAINVRNNKGIAYGVQALRNANDETSGDTANIDIRLTPQNLLLNDLKGIELYVDIAVRDSCPNADSREKNARLTIKVTPPSTQFKTSTERISQAVVGFNNTDGDGDTIMILQILNGENIVAAGGNIYDMAGNGKALDDLGDSRDDEQCEVDDQSTCHNWIRIPLTVVDGVVDDISTFTTARFNFPTTGADNIETLKVVYYSYIIQTDSWCASALITSPNVNECEGPSCWHDFPLTWSLRTPGESCPEYVAN